MPSILINISGDLKFKLPSRKRDGLRVQGFQGSGGPGAVTKRKQADSTSCGKKANQRPSAEPVAYEGSEGSRKMKALDSPRISRVVFHPRGEDDRYSPVGIATTTPCENAVISGYLHLNEKSDGLLLFFHGNGEISADYDTMAQVYLSLGVSCWFVDFRGYGRSTGTPAFSHMFSDAETLFRYIPRLRDLTGNSFKHLLVMGRSLGSASAIYLASIHHRDLDGLILDSAYAHGPDLIRRLGGPGIAPEELTGLKIILTVSINAPCRPSSSMARMILSIPFSDALALYRACRSPAKRLVEIEGAGHNDLLYHGMDTYLSALRDFINQIRP